MVTPDDGDKGPGGYRSASAIRSPRVSRGFPGALGIRPIRRRNRTGVSFGTRGSHDHLRNQSCDVVEFSKGSMRMNGVGVVEPGKLQHFMSFEPGNDANHSLGDGFDRYFCSIGITEAERGAYTGIVRPGPTRIRNARLFHPYDPVGRTILRQRMIRCVGDLRASEEGALPIRVAKPLTIALELRPDGILVRHVADSAPQEAFVAHWFGCHAPLFARRSARRLRTSADGPRFGMGNGTDVARLVGR